MKNVHVRAVIGVAAVAGATVLAFYGMNGWGWLVFVAVLTVFE